jgi:hypothetical protein
VEVGKGVGVACWAALVSACSGFKVGVVGSSVTKGVIFGAGMSMLQLESSTTKNPQTNRPTTRLLPIKHDSNTPHARKILINSNTLTTP